MENSSEPLSKNMRLFVCLFVYFKFNSVQIDEISLFQKVASESSPRLTSFFSIELHRFQIFKSTKKGGCNDLKET